MLVLVGIVILVLHWWVLNRTRTSTRPPHPPYTAPCPYTSVWGGRGQAQGPRIHPTLPLVPTHPFGEMDIPFGEIDL